MRICRAVFCLKPACIIDNFTKLDIPILDVYRTQYFLSFSIRALKYTCQYSERIKIM